MIKDCLISSKFLTFLLSTLKLWLHSYINFSENIIVLISDNYLSFYLI